ncbi:phosphopantetheine-binding protein [Streptomyces olivaceus]|uniref:phosphopantetheine-binding protein n=1 Tax=Streptomyces olivaceus TaxID=47716 RepID=UPI0036C607AE
MSRQWDDRFEDALRPHLTYLKADAKLIEDARLGDLGLDSLAVVGLLMDIEERYDIVFPDEHLNPETFRTVRSLWSVVQDLVYPILRTESGSTEAPSA